MNYYSIKFITLFILLLGINAENLDTASNNMTVIGTIQNSNEEEIFYFTNAAVCSITFLISLSLYYYSLRMNPILKFLFRMNLSLLVIQIAQFILTSFNNDFYYLFNFVKYMIIFISVEKLLYFRELFDFNLVRRSKIILFMGFYLIYYILYFLIEEENSKRHNILSILVLIIRFSFTLSYWFYLLSSLKELLRLFITCSDYESNSEIVLKIFNPNLKELELFLIYRAWYNIMFSVFSLLLMYGVLLLSLEFSQVETQYHLTIHTISEILYHLIFLIYVIGMFFIIRMFDSYMKVTTSELDYTVSNQSTHDEEAEVVNRLNIV